jgi:hypothetical protein
MTDVGDDATRLLQQLFGDQDEQDEFVKHGGHFDSGSAKELVESVRALLEERTRFREALQEAIETQKKLSRFDHVEWHHDHEDKTPDECPECEGTRAHIKRLESALAETQP